MNGPRLRGLYLITPDLCDTRELLAVTTPVLAARPALLQYRNKQADAALRRAQARALLAPCRDHGVPLIINDDQALAAELGVGVHLGRDDGDLRAARARLGEAALIGVSCYGDLERARAAVADGASHVAFGSVFASSTKPDAPRVALATLQRASAELPVPVCAIGGIDLDNVPALLAAGVDLLAVIQDVFGHADPAARARAYARLFDRR